jgi:anti-sigma regulatory factor (Ser/Thr protein kinase)
MGRRADVVHGTSFRPTWVPEPGSGVGPASTRRPAVTAPWPMMDTLTLGALPTAVGSARVHARVLVSEWAMPDMAENVALIVSELMTNAVLAFTDLDGRPKYADVSAGLPVVHLRLSSDHVRLVIEVWDLSPQVPEARQPEPDAENGRGLVLVEALSQRWGWEHFPGWPGKVVWAELRVE